MEAILWILVILFCLIFAWSIIRGIVLFFVETIWTLIFSPGKMLLWLALIIAIFVSMCAPG
jgi:hypothetical protein